MEARCDQFSDEFRIKLARLWLVEDVFNARDVLWCHFMIASTDMHVCQRRNSRLRPMPSWFKCISVFGLVRDSVVRMRRSSLSSTCQAYLRKHHFVLLYPRWTAAFNPKCEERDCRDIFL